jgi:hypothetical protein
MIPKSGKIGYHFSLKSNSKRRAIINTAFRSTVNINAGQREIYRGISKINLKNRTCSSLSWLPMPDSN